MRLFVLAVLFLTLLPRMAAADCVSDCQASTYCGGSSYECAQLQNECYRRECARNNDSAPAHAGGAYGAIAYDKKSGAWGLADAAADKSGAKESALGYCAENGDDCKIVKTFSSSCAAVAVHTDGTMDWAVDKDRRKAGEQAVAGCNKKTGSRLCHIRLLHCYAE